MQLLLITNDFPPTRGGIENYLYSLVSRLPPEEVAVLTRWVPGADEIDASLTFEVRRLRTRTLGYGRRMLSAASEMIKRRNVNIVHFGAPFLPALAGPRLRKRHGVPYAVSIHGGEFVLASEIPGLGGLMRRSLLGAAAVLCESRFVEHRAGVYLRGEGGTLYLPAGVDTVTFRPGLPAEFRPPLGGPLILSVSRLVARKGPGTLIEALPPVLDAHPDAHLLIVGGGPDRRRLGRLATRLRVTPAVTFAGPQPWEKIPGYYASAEVFALPTRERFGGLETEGLPLVYLEAAASGLPSVAGRAGGVADAVVDGVTGIMVDGRDANGTAQALLRLLDEPETRAAMGSRARQRVVADFSWDSIASRYASALSGVIGRT